MPDRATRVCATMLERCEHSLGHAVDVPALVHRNVIDGERRGVRYLEVLERTGDELNAVDPGTRECSPSRLDRVGVTVDPHELAMRWRSQLGQDDLDPHLLMWDMHRNLDLDALPGGRVVLAFDFTDIPAHTRHWWIVVEPGGSADLCDWLRLSPFAGVPRVKAATA